MLDVLRVHIHQEYFHAVLFRELVERHDVAHPRAVVDLPHWLVDNVASLYLVNRLTNYLKSLGHKVPKAAVSDYLAWFEDAYFLSTVRIHDASLACANTNPTPRRSIASTMPWWSRCPPAFWSTKGTAWRTWCSWPCDGSRPISITTGPAI